MWFLFLRLQVNSTFFQLAMKYAVAVSSEIEGALLWNQSASGAEHRMAQRNNKNREFAIK